MGEQASDEGITIQIKNSNNRKRF